MRREREDDEEEEEWGGVDLFLNIADVKLSKNCPHSLCVGEKGELCGCMYVRRYE